jgi:selenide,water dikinase
MHDVSGPGRKSVVLIGAGHAHVGALRLFGLRPLPQAVLTLVSRGRFTPYSGMLPGLIAGHYHVNDVHIDTVPLARFAGARLYQDEAVGLDLANRLVICRNSPPLRYDVLSIDIGSTPNTADVPGAAAHAIAVKPISRFLPRFERLLGRVLTRRGKAAVACVGGGAGGVELLLSIERRLRREVTAAGYAASGLSFALVTASDDILSNFPPAFRARFRAVLAARGIEVVTGAAVTEVKGAGVEAKQLVFTDRAPIAADEIMWTAQAAPARWLAGTGLPLDAHGFIRVNDYLRAMGHEDIFAAGDIIAFAARALPKSGVYAVREGPVIADNIRCMLLGAAPRAFKPQREALYLVSTGEQYAIGSRNGFTFAGGWVWRWKDWIDRRFMRQFKELPKNAALPERETRRSGHD